MIVTTGEVAVVAAATAFGLVLFGLAAALHLVWRATDVDLPTDAELRLETSAFACRRHLSYVAEYHPDAMAGMDQAVLIDLYESGRGR